MKLEDTVLTVFLFVLIALAGFVLGTELNEKKHCENMNGVYSWDYGTCLEKSTIRVLDMKGRK